MDPATLTERRRSSNPRGRPAAAEAADIRTAILDAAELLFARQGYAATSVRAIAEAVEVTPAMVHYYFGNKLALLRQVLERTLEPLAAAIGKMRVASQAPAADIAHLLLRTFSEHPSLPVLVAREVILPGGVMQQHFLEYLAPRLGGSLPAMLEREQAAGRVHPDLDPQVASLLLLSLCAFPFIAHDLAGPALRIAYDEEGVRRLEHHIERVLQEGFAP
jgi:TetR/AcrR family transcriptional regulator